MSVSHSRPLRWIFDHYLNFLFWRKFKNVHTEILERPESTGRLLIEKKPILLVANHCSWWDGFFLARLQRQIAPHGSLFTVMLESELRKFPLFRRLGAVGLDPANPVSVARTFYKLKKLTQEQTGPVFIAYFPQGEIRPQFESRLNFKPGVELLIRMLGSLQIVPVALGIEPLNASKPFGFILVGEPIVVGPDSNVSAQSLETLVESLLQNERPKLVSRYLAASAVP